MAEDASRLWFKIRFDGVAGGRDPGNERQTRKPPGRRRLLKIDLPAGVSEIFSGGWVDRFVRCEGDLPDEQINHT
jgi:hypothetical protein